MFSLFVVLLSFSSYFALYQTKCLLLNDEPCMIKPTFINMNRIELKYYLFMINLKNAQEVLMSYLQKYVFQKEHLR